MFGCVENSYGTHTRRYGYGEQVLPQPREHECRSYFRHSQTSAGNRNGDNSYSTTRRQRLVVLIFAKVRRQGQGHRVEGGSLRRLAPLHGTLLPRPPNQLFRRECGDPEQGGKKRLELMWRRLGV